MSHMDESMRKAHAIQPDAVHGTIDGECCYMGRSIPAAIRDLSVMDAGMTYAVAFIEGKMNRDYGMGAGFN